MICIVAVEDSSPLMLVQSARTMFKAYGEFVRNSGNHPGFRFDRLDQEILELPDAYSMRNGEVLLAMRRSEVVGCIAYRGSCHASESKNVRNQTPLCAP